MSRIGLEELYRCLRAVQLHVHVERNFVGGAAVEDADLVLFVQSFNAFEAVASYILVVYQVVIHVMLSH